jgi:hypothetical protein
VVVLSESDWERIIKRSLEPAKPEYEKVIEEAEVEVDEFKRISGELKEKYGVEQKPARGKTVKCPRCGYEFAVNPGDPAEVEEAEYEEVRRRARLAKGEKLLPV